MKNALKKSLNSVLFLMVIASTGTVFGQTPLVGKWNAELSSPGGALRFGIEFLRSDDAWSCFLINGPERIKIPKVEFDGKHGTVDISHFDSKIEFSVEEDAKTLVGEWTKRKGIDKWSKLNFRAKRPIGKTKNLGASKPFLGRWCVKFDSDSDDSVAVFKKFEEDRVLGTFMTTTGDYRFLDGVVEDGALKLSCFDGAHAFHFHARLNGKDEIEGDFWSSDSWHDTWRGSRDDDASLPDAFAETKATDTGLGNLSFPDLSGVPKRLDATEFAGKARLIYVFGSWCPNCHDAAEYFSELTMKYGDELSILGLAFEHTGDFQRDSEQVKRYLKRHKSSYPVLVAGLSDKKIASKAVPILDRVRSYPTTIFVDSKNKIRAIHTGFTGPATGQDYVDLKKKFESIIDEMIAKVGTTQDR